MTSPVLIHATNHSSVLNFTNVSSVSWTSFSTAAITPEQYHPPFDKTAIIASSAFIFLFLVIGLIGNFTTIIVIATNAPLRRTWGFDRWDPLPSGLCKFFWGSDIMTNYSTALHIFSFALLRYLSIQFPLQFKKLQPIHVKIWVGAIWISAFLFGFIPGTILFNATERDRYSDAPDARWPSCDPAQGWFDVYTLYQRICFPVFLYFPSLGVIVLSVLIARKVHSKTDELNSIQRKKERQALLQLVLITLCFFIGYIPFTAYEFWSFVPRPNTPYNRQFDYWFGTIQYFFLRFSECTNPILYNLGSSKMRFYTKQFMRNILCSVCIKKNQKIVMNSLQDLHQRTSIATIFESRS
ncbi:growth hormone secretagogue receptor type 1-like isoform X2 [Clavelina lepadiformis]|uniref:G-protein coupled receptors family 1 profile domain-containing protein n=1 Tax=Clavelina lepadiformis TaxID=159417 RepID=A0ABP0EZF6_CLALP